MLQLDISQDFEDIQRRSPSHSGGGRSSPLNLLQGLKHQKKAAVLTINQITEILQLNEQELESKIDQS